MIITSLSLVNTKIYEIVQPEAGQYWIQPWNVDSVNLMTDEINVSFTWLRNTLGSKRMVNCFLTLKDAKDELVKRRRANPREQLTK